MLEKFIHRPTDCRGRHLVAYSCSDSLVVTPDARCAVDLLERTDCTGDLLLIGRPEAALHPCVQQSLGYVQRVRDTGSKGPRPRPREHVRDWVILALVVHMILQELIADEVDDLERDVHAQLGGVAPIERYDPF